MKIFISYAHIDLDLVKEKVVDVLRAGGHEPWFDHSLTVGKEWKPQLSDAIRNRDVFLYALTSESLASEWCRWELGKAQALKKPIIPVLLRSCTIPNELASLREVQYVDYTGKSYPPTIAVAKLMDGLNQATPLPKPVDTPSDPSGVPSRADTQADRIAYEKASKDDMIRRLLSEDSAIVKIALEEAREKGWLHDGTLKGAHLEGIKLEGLDLQYANLEGAHLELANLKNAKLQYANLQGANLGSACLEDANLEDANLKRATMDQAYLNRATLTNAHLQNSILVSARLQYANLEVVNLTGACLLNAKLQGAELTNATLPDGTKWTPETDMERFTNSEHPQFSHEEWLKNCQRKRNRT